MTAQTVTQLAIAGVMAISAGGCALLGPTCVARQQGGTVATLTGEVTPGAIVSHQVRYDTQGSQNDAEVSWDSFRSATAPRLRFYATSVACRDFHAPPAINTGDCATLASAGWTEIGIASRLILTHGRGNPERLGSPPEYKIWVVGDADRSARYTITVTWFFGPDC